MKRNRRKRRERSWVRRLGWAVRAGGAGIAVAAAVAAVAWGARWVVGHPYFGLLEVEISGARDPDALLAWAGVRRGTSLFRLDPGQIESRLRTHARIRAVRVERDFPDRLRIEIEERDPLAVVLLGEPLFVDEEGQLFRPRDRELLDDRPYVTGIKAGDLETRPAWSNARLREAARALRLWQRHPDWPAASEVRPENDGEIVVFPQGVQMTIRLGKEVNEEQFTRLSAVLDLWRGRESQITGIDLTVPGQAIVRLRKGASTAPRMRI